MLLRARRRRIACRILIGLIGAVGLLWCGLIACRILYPLTYRDDILAYSVAHDLDPALIAAVVRNESRFDPAAVSVAGAVGLMQLMPGTARWIALQQEIASPDTNDLQDPVINLSLGTWYLRYLIDRFGELDAALMAYNAGPSNAEQWEGDIQRAFSETQTYVRRVHASLPVYRIYFSAAWLDLLLPPIRPWR